MKALLTEIFDFILPRICPSCNSKLLPEETAICSSCFSRIKIAEEDRITFEFRKKFEGKNIISGFASMFIFEKDKEIQHIIHSIKYSQRFLNGMFLGKIMSLFIEDKINAWKIDLLIPVPLHSVKKAERGFNQSYYISKGISRNFKIPIDEKSLKRKRYTQSQTTMNLIERQENIKDAFRVKHKKIIAGKNILLIDDVITTGATVAECGRMLLENGAKSVYAASIAIAD